MGDETTDDYTSVLDSTNQDNTSGTTGYSVDNSTANITGGVVNTAQNPLPAPDASGGNGSILGGLQAVFTQGLNDSIVSASEFAIGSLTDRLSANAYGSVQPASAQGVTVSASSGVIKFALLAVAAFVVYKLVE